MSLHTPGPWQTDGPFSIQTDTEIRCNGMVVQNDFGNPLASVTFGEDCSVTTKANARLMAAAPDLLRACYLALDLLDTKTPEDVETEALRTLKQAINKAICL